MLLLLTLVVVNSVGFHSSFSFVLLFGAWLFLGCLVLLFACGVYLLLLIMWLYMVAC